MESPLYTETLNGYTLTIDYEQFADDPTNWGNFTVKHWRDYDDGTGELTIDASKFADGRAHWVDKYEHGGASYTLHGRGTNDRWDTSRKWGIIEFTDEYATNADTLEGRREMARQDLKLYTEWANGEVYRADITEDATGEYIDGVGDCYDLESTIEQGRSELARLAPTPSAAAAPSASSLHR